jgi:small GTP-binding protein
MAAATTFDHLFKIVLVGDSGVGKSNLLSRFTRDVFTIDEKSTIGVEFATRIVTMEDGKNIKMQVWDTAGQERYRAITKAYYRGALGALLVYDISSKESFDNVTRWLNELKSHSNKDKEIVLIVVGNKKDVVEANPELRQVTEEMMREMSTTLDVPVMEASAKTGENVENCFISVTKSIYTGSYSGGAKAGSSGSTASSPAKKSDTVSLSGGEGKKASKGCC